MAKLPQVPGERVARALEHAGWRRGRGGRHAIMMERTDEQGRVVARVPIPMHGSTPIRPGTLRRIIKLVGLTNDEFTSLL